MIAAKARLRGGVERRRRLVEQPQRPMGDEEAGERDAPLLPGRERARGKVDHMGEADPGERRAAGFARRIAAERARPEGEVLAGGQRPFQRVGVAEIMRLLADRALGIAALEGEAARLRTAESRKAPAEGSTFPRRSAR